MQLEFYKDLSTCTCAECAKFWDSKRKLKNVDKTPRKHAKLKEWQ